MYELPFQQSPCNFKEEERLLCRLYRLFGIMEAMEYAFQDTRPRLARDLSGVIAILGRLASSVEDRLYRPNRLRVWEDREARAKPAPANFRLLVRLLAITRQASSDVLRVHDAAVREEGEEDCTCWVCHDVYEIRWFLGTVKRLLSAAVSISKGEHHETGK